VSHYVVEEVLGRGSFGVVRRAVDTRSGREVAVKMFSKRTLARGGFTMPQLRNELEVMLLAGGHPNVVRLLDLVETQRHLYVVMQLVPGGDLFTLLTRRRGPLPVDEASSVVRQMAAALAHLHLRRVCHRDLKPENVLVRHRSRGGLDVKVADFGLARVQQAAGLCSTECGSLAYTAPEVLRAGPYDGLAADVWSLGVVAFAVVTGCSPFYGRTPEAIRARILAGRYAVPPDTDADAADFVARCLQAEPAARPTVHELRHHPFLQPRQPQEGSARTGGGEAAPDGARAAAASGRVKGPPVPSRRPAIRAVVRLADRHRRGPP
jgi:serine/threonine protein kinase